MDVTITGLEVLGWQYGATPELRIYSSGFVAADGTVVPAGSPAGGQPYKAVPCTVAGERVTADDFTLPSTTDSLDNTLANYTGVLFDAQGRQHILAFAGYSVPTSLGASTSYAFLTAHNRAVAPVRDTETYTKTQINDMLALVPPSGAAGGDLSGEYPDPTVAKLQGRDVATTAPADGDALLWSATSSRWQPGATSGGSGIASYAYAALAALISLVVGTLVYVTDGIRGLYYKTKSTIWVSLLGKAILHDFYASGDATTTTTTGSNANGATSIAVASSSTFYNGQGIYIAGAGAAGAPYIGTVNGTPPNGTHINVTPAISTTVSAGALVQHDDSAAIQAAINAIVAHGGGQVYGHNGRYRCNGAFDAVSNGIITLPTNVSTNAPITIDLDGESVERTSANAGQFRGFVVDYSERCALGALGGSDGQTIASLFAAREAASTGSLSGFNYVHFNPTNVHIKACPNPKAGAFNMRNAIGGHFKNCQVSTGEAPTTALTEPTDPYVTAFFAPAVNNHAQISFEGCSVIGFPRAFVVSEHAHFIGDNYASFCKIGLECQQGGHVNWGKLGCEYCTTMIKVTGTPSVIDLTLSGESDRTSGTWPQGTYDFDDGSQTLVGEIRAEITLGGVGSTVSPRRNGAANIFLRNLRSGVVESGPVFKDTSSYWSLSGTPIRIVDTHANGSVCSIQGVPNGAGLFDFIRTANGHIEGGGATRSYAGTSWRDILSNARNGYAVQFAPAGGLSPVFVDRLFVDDAGAAGETSLLLWDVTAGTLKRVSVGAADSGGAGYKALRVPN